MLGFQSKFKTKIRAKLVKYTYTEQLRYKIW